MKSVSEIDNEIEVVDENHERWVRVRIRERQGISFADVRKCSVFLTPDQLEKHAHECLVLAAKIRSRL